MTRNVLDWLDATAERRPQAPAFRSREEEVSYERLNTRSKEIGSFLSEQIKPQSGVLLFMEKGPDCLCAMMGIVRAGCFYTPIDPLMPKERMQLIISVLQPAAIVCSGKYQEAAKALAAEQAAAQGVQAAAQAAKTEGAEQGAKAEAEQGVKTEASQGAKSEAKMQVPAPVPVFVQEDIPQEINPAALEAIRAAHLDNDLLYVLFTSGSTGLPKGVAITHRSVIDFIDWTTATLPVDEDCVFGNQAPLYFDNSVLDIYTSIRIGACVDFIPAALFSFPGKLMRYIIDQNINTLFWVPSALANVSASGILDSEVPALRNIFFCGEVMHCSTLNAWKRVLPKANYVNMYGPTEITDVCAYYIIDREFADTDKLPIGYPCSNSWVGLIDGEICVGGTCLSPGYYNAPEKTAEVFVQNPLRPQIREIIYRTGDLGEYNERGELMFLGRKDSQIKRHGYRIELGEIETALCSLPGVAKGCCLYDSARDTLVGFYTGDPDEKEVNRGLKKKLPKYMLPDVYVHAYALPETGNGKMDRVRIRQEWENEHSLA